MVDIDIHPVSGSIGAEILGINVATELSDEAIARVRQALLEHKVVFFRDQFDVDDGVQEAFAKRFGELQRHPMVKASGNSNALLELTEGYSASVWHTDLTFMPDPSAFAVLRPVQLPPVGGDTLWANAACQPNRGFDPLGELKN